MIQVLWKEWKKHVTWLHCLTTHFLVFVLHAKNTCQMWGLKPKPPEILPLSFSSQLIQYQYLIMPQYATETCSIMQHRHKAVFWTKLVSRNPPFSHSSPPFSPTAFITFTFFADLTGLHGVWKPTIMSGIICNIEWGLAIAILDSWRMNDFWDWLVCLLF